MLGLDESITSDVAFPSRTDEDDSVGPNLWEFNPKRTASVLGTTLSECTTETGTGRSLRLVKEIYEVEGSSETSVPILYDKESKRIVSNESAEIVRMLNSHASALGSTPALDRRPDVYPAGDDHRQLRHQIDELNQLIYNNINNGAYKAGFSSDQRIYAQAFTNYSRLLKNSRTSWHQPAPPA